MELLHEPETCERFHRAVAHNFSHLLPLLQPPPATDRQSAKAQVYTACSALIYVLRQAATDTLRHRTVVPGVTKPLLTRQGPDICARRRLAFARHKLEPSPINLDCFKAADELARTTCRAAQRRQKRQQEASAQRHWHTAPGSHAAWEKIRKLADRADMPLHSAQQLCIRTQAPCAPPQLTRCPRLHPIIGSSSAHPMLALRTKLNSAHRAHPLCTTSVRPTQLTNLPWKHPSAWRTFARPSPEWPITRLQEQMASPRNC
jgi:hypothetical protein